MAANSRKRIAKCASNPSDGARLTGKPSPAEAPPVALIPTSDAGGYAELNGAKLTGESTAPVSDEHESTGAADNSASDLGGAMSNLGI
jgi:hypothetical protein